MLNMIAAEMSDALYKTYIGLTIAGLIIIFLVALLTIIIVLMQKSNSDGIQGITASSETFFGKHKGKSIESKLKRWTWICLAIIGVLSIVLFILQVIYR